MDMRHITYDIDDHIVELRNAVFIKEQGISIVDEYEDNEKEYIHLSEFFEDKLVAYARMKVILPIAFVGRVAVCKSFRSRGYGRSIMSFAEDEAKKRGCASVQMHAQIQAQAFYEKIGYIVDGEKFMEAGIPHIKMTRKL